MTHPKPAAAMRMAWSIARDGSRTFGGRVSMYLREALRLAWRAVLGTTGSDAERVRRLTIERRHRREAVFAKFSPAFRRAAHHGGACGLDPNRWASGVYHAAGR